MSALAPLPEGERRRRWDILVENSLDDHNLSMGDRVRDQVIRETDLYIGRLESALREIEKSLMQWDGPPRHRDHCHVCRARRSAQLLVDDEIVDGEHSPRTDDDF